MGDSLKAFISGGVGGMCSVVVGQPLDTVKVRLMTDSKGEYRGMMDCLRRTVAKDGLRGLYVGMGAPLLFITPIYAIDFWAFEVGKQLASRIEGSSKTEQVSTAGIMFAGAFAAFPGTAVMVPGDLIKVKLQVEQNKPAQEQAFRGPWACAKAVVKENGIFGLWKGTALTLLRDVPSMMANLGLYDLLKREMLLVPSPLRNGGEGDESLSSMGIICGGGFAGMASWFIAVPPDVLKSRFQSAPEGTYPGGLRQVFRELVKKEGLGAMFKGMTPALLRAFPANAACFMGMEVTRKFLNGQF